MSEALFSNFASADEGVATITWWFNDDAVSPAPCPHAHRDEMTDMTTIVFFFRFRLAPSPSSSCAYHLEHPRLDPPCARAYYLEHPCLDPSSPGD